jgi:putative toxin-antitoxin system antitoxin component (TIGR02293 family)
MARLAYTAIMTHMLTRRHLPLRASERHTHRYDPLGSSLGLSADCTDELIREVRKGLSFKALQSLSRESGISVPELASIIEIPDRTLARRKAAGRLARDESERLLRISSIFEKTLELFNGDVPEAVAWLRRPRRALADHTPLAYSGSELGAREVENLIGQLEYGVFP